MTIALAKPECAYCGATEGLRVRCDGGEFAFGFCIQSPEYVCESCFKGTDCGPNFDDLKPVA